MRKTCSSHTRKPGSERSDPAAGAAQSALRLTQKSPQRYEERDVLWVTAKSSSMGRTRTLTWDQGHEMAAHPQFTVSTEVPDYFCDPKSPWQRGLRRRLARTVDVLCREP